MPNGQDHQRGAWFTRARPDGIGLRRQVSEKVNLRGMSCCRIREHRDPVFMRLENGNDEKSSQLRVLA